MDWPDCALLVVVFFLILESTAAQEGVFESSCDRDQQSMTFTFQSGSEGNPTFIYATGHPNECSLTSSNPQITGAGTAADPYTLTVSPMVSGETTACGIQGSNSEYFFTVEVRFGVILDINDPRDKIFNVSCDFSPETPPTVLAQYACDGTKKLHFSFATNGPLPSDIYSVGKKSTCGKAAGVGMGAGTLEDRYELAIDLSVTPQSPDCGVQEISPNIYNVQLIVQSSPLILQADDVTYNVTCDFSQPFTELSSADGVTVDEQLTHGSASNLQGKAALTVVDSEDNAVDRITLGQLIKLQVELVGSDAEGVRVRNCDVRPSVSSSQVINLLDSNGCSIDGEVSIGSFVSSEGTEAHTPTFKAFRFVEADSLVFLCMVDFCYDTNKVRCIADHCSADGRRRRDVDPKNLEQVKTLLVILETPESDNKHSSDSLSGDKVNSSSASPSDVRVGCPETLYSVVLGFILLIITLLLIISCLVCLYCLRMRRRIEQEKT